MAYLHGADSVAKLHLMYLYDINRVFPNKQKVIVMFGLRLVTETKFHWSTEGVLFYLETWSATLGLLDDFPGGLKNRMTDLKRKFISQWQLVDTMNGVCGCL